MNPHNIYVVQLLIVGLGILALVWRLNFVYRLQVLGWVLLNFVILLRYGQSGQLEFYSNDQRIFVAVTDALASGMVVHEPLSWWISSARIPFTLPAVLLASAGLDTALALKTTSLLFILGLTQLVLQHARIRSLTGFATLVFMTGIAFSGTFFSSLAQRETSMMFFTFLVFVGKSPALRGTSLLMLVLLRPHLAVAIGLGWLCTVLVQQSSRRRNWSPGRAATAIASGSVVGYLLFAMGFQFQTGISGVFGHQFGLRPVLRIASNYVGLQFLTAYETTIEFTLVQLLLGRLLFSETILIPLAFTLLVLTSRDASPVMRWTMWSFAIYVGLVTNTDFNSFRQNVPLMPVMGFCVVNALQRWRALRVSDDKAKTLVET